MNCARCGAGLDFNALACPYCQTATAAGLQAQAAEQQRVSWWAAHKAQTDDLQRRLMHQRLEGTAATALWTSLGSLLLCFLPILQVISIVSFFRARGMAKALGVPVPGKATAGLVVSLVALVMGVAFVVWAGVRDDELEGAAQQRVAVLQKQTAASAQAPILDRGTACALTELNALEDGYGGERGHNLKSFDCVGKLTTHADRASLEDVRFRVDPGGAKRTVTACFKRGARWYVSELREGAECPGGEVPASGVARRK